MLDPTVDRTSFVCFITCTLSIESVALAFPVFRLTIKMFSGLIVRLNWRSLPEDVCKKQIIGLDSYGLAGSEAAAASVRGELPCS